MGSGKSTENKNNPIHKLCVASGQRVTMTMMVSFANNGNHHLFLFPLLHDALSSCHLSHDWVHLNFRRFDLRDDFALTMVTVTSPFVVAGHDFPAVARRLWDPGDMHLDPTVDPALTFGAVAIIAVVPSSMVLPWLWVQASTACHLALDVQASSTPLNSLTRAFPANLFHHPHLAVLSCPTAPKTRHAEALLSTLSLAADNDFAHDFTHPVTVSLLASCLVSPCSPKHHPLEFLLGQFCDSTTVMVPSMCWKHS